jgi:hypothetical protein
MGWVSIFDPLALARLLQMPEGAHPLGVLCLGPVDAYYAEPMLQQEKWACRAPLEDMLMDDVWDDCAWWLRRPRASRQRAVRREEQNRRMTSFGWTELIGLSLSPLAALSDIHRQ